MLKFNSLFLAGIWVGVSCAGGGGLDPTPDLSMASPDGRVTLQVWNAAGRLSFDARLDGETMLKVSALGLPYDGTSHPAVRITRSELTRIDETWTSVIGKNREVRNHCHAYTLHGESEKGGDFHIEFRCYNDGFAYRYGVPVRRTPDEHAPLRGTETLHVPGDFAFWSYNGERHNVGPLLRSSDAVPSVIRPPMVIRSPGGQFMAILESGVLYQAPFALRAPAGEQSLQIESDSPIPEHPARSSWRTFLLGGQAGDLLESDLAANLNEPCKIQDPSWIKPGRTLWDWRVWGYEAEDGFRYALDTRSHLRLIDFAAANRIQYLLIDADWYGAEFSKESDPTTANDNVDIEACMRYAKEREVGVFLYLNDVGARRFGLERVLKQFSDWGAVGVKYGFMRGTWEEKAIHTRHVVERCAAHRLMVNFHDNPIPPSGDERTWPNLVTREFGHSQADAKRSYFPETAVTAPFVNMLGGPVDYCDGWFALHGAQQDRERVFEDIPGTVAAEVAKLIVIYSAFSVLPDAPEEYRKKDDLFACIRQMPARFDAYQVLAGEIGEYICVARRHGENWFIGTLTNRDGRDQKIDFGFLPEGTLYRATFYEDAEHSHFQNHREAYTIRTARIYAGDTITVRLAPGGGHAIHLQRIPDHGEHPRHPTDFPHPQGERIRPRI